MNTWVKRIQSNPIPQFWRIECMLDRVRFLYRAQRYKNSLDKAEIAYLCSTLKAGDTAIDIGAHKGAYSYWMARSVGKQGRCFAFEPQPELYDYLKKITRKMGLNQIKVELTALSDKSGPAVLHLPDDHRTSPGASLEAKSTMLREIEVTTSTIDKYFREMEIAPRLIKIDVEGHELAVLKGGEEMLKNHRPAVMVECEERHSSTQAVFDYLLNLGFEGSFFFNGGRLALSKFDLTKHQSQKGDRFWMKSTYVNNFIFT